MLEGWAYWTSNSGSLHLTLLLYLLLTLSFFLQKLPSVFFRFFIHANYCNLHTIKTELIEIHLGWGMKRYILAELYFFRASEEGEEIFKVLQNVLEVLLAFPQALDKRWFWKAIKLPSLWGSLDAQKQLRIHLLPWSLQQSLCCWKRYNASKSMDFPWFCWLVWLLASKSGEASQDSFHQSLQGYLLLNTAPCVAMGVQFCAARGVGMDSWELCWVPHPSPPETGSWG